MGHLVDGGLVDWSVFMLVGSMGPSCKCEAGDWEVV